MTNWAKIIYKFKKLWIVCISRNFWKGKQGSQKTWIYSCWTCNMLCINASYSYGKWSYLTMSFVFCIKNDFKLEWFYQVMAKGKFATSVSCMDGRIQIPLTNWIKENFSVDYVDTIKNPELINKLHTILILNQLKPK